MISKIWKNYVLSSAFITTHMEVHLRSTLICLMVENNDISDSSVYQGSYILFYVYGHDLFSTLTAIVDIVSINILFFFVSSWVCTEFSTILK